MLATDAVLRALVLATEATGAHVLSAAAAAAAIAAVHTVAAAATRARHGLERRVLVAW
jgi:hypothetical protein